MMELRIAKAQEKDMDEIENLYNVLNDYLESHVNYPGWRKGIYPTREHALHFFRSNTLYVARNDGQIVGSVALTHEPEKDPDNGTWLIDADYENIFVVHVLAVHPDCLRCGVGSALLLFAEELAQKQNIKSIRLDVYENNAAAIRAYEKSGYTYIDTVDIGLGCYGLDWFRLYEKVILP